MNKYKIKIDLYDIDVMLLIGDNDSVQEYFSKKYGADKLLDTSVKGETYKISKYNSTYPHIYIWMPNFNINNIDNICTLHHESIHVSFIINDYIGVKVDFNNQEALTYISDYILKKFLEKLLKGEK